MLVNKLIFYKNKNIFKSSNKDLYALKNMFFLMHCQVDFCELLTPLTYSNMQYMSKVP